MCWIEIKDNINVQVADKDTFIPYYMNGFTYKTGGEYLRYPDFNSNSITVGFHGYINIIVTDIKSLQLYAVNS